MSWLRNCLLLLSKGRKSTEQAKAIASSRDRDRDNWNH